MVVQDRRGGAVAAAVCGVGLAVGLLTTGCSPNGAAADDHASAGRSADGPVGGSAAGPPFTDRARPPGARPRDPAGPSAAGAPSGRTDYAAALRACADALVRAGSSRVRTEMETVSGGTRVAIRGTGGHDYRKRTGRLNVRLPDTGGGRGAPHTITEILTPSALYMKNRGAGVPADKWVRVDTASLADGNLVTGGATDPMAAAELLRGVREVTYEGRERLDGTPVRHFSGTTDIGSAARAASPAVRPALTAAEKGFTTDVVAFDAYLDDAGRLRKVRQRFRFANGTTGGTSVTSTTTLYGFGAPVPVRLPDRDDIYTGRVAATGG
ncbi:hypothetical protein A6A06_06140 [Streptomyces sp. CB02923]|uniref:hypothetical protein n=1 Tax=Streptomyces sp. CB02923 TaxID=1718985 RepID=UPI00093BAF2D|nr:hypothetical protein [Streptomyces sp. CB02923]OKI10176.1 hypothetical protein A6A06_06140 [Streptomyces sp. CB02923]